MLAPSLLPSHCDQTHQVHIIRRHNVDSVLHDTIDDAVVRICTLVIALQPLEPRIPCNPERDPVSRTQLLQLRHNAVGDHRCRLSI